MSTPISLSAWSETAGGYPITARPNRRAAARDCHWVCVGTHYDTELRLQEPIKDPARFPWHEVTKVAHYYLSVDALKQPMDVREDSPPHGGGS